MVGVWTVFDVVGGGLGMVVAVLYKIVRDPSLLTVIGGDLHVRSESTTRSGVVFRQSSHCAVVMIQYGGRRRSRHCRVRSRHCW